VDIAKVMLENTKAINAYNLIEYNYMKLIIPHYSKTDITYIPMFRGFMYMNAIIDVYSRKILNWSISNSMDKEWCIELLEDTIAKYGAPEIHNSDQGAQYTSSQYIDVLKKHEIQISMDGKGRALDNIYIERFWKSIK
jgi:putative transposase